MDTSALLKTVHVESESSALNAYLDEVTDEGTVLVTSSITIVELERALRARVERVGPTPGGPPLRESVNWALAGLVELRVTATVIRLARWLGPPLLRSLDAIHLASALLDGADGIVTYDRRLAEAAQAANLAIHSPGSRCP